MRTTRLVAAGLVAASAMLAVPASASTEDQLPDNAIVYQGGAIPGDLAATFAQCPEQSDMPEGFAYFYCVKVRAYDGVLQLGSVRATIDEPIEILAGIGANLSTGELAIVPAAGAAGASTSPVEISGGILGIPELDPLIDLDPLGLLALSATPTIGDLSAEAEGLQPTHLPSITLPLSIQLNNTLFGDHCRIGTTDEPVTIELRTDGPGGHPPVQSPEYQWGNYTGGVPSYRTGTGARSVDASFAVPGVDCPGIGGIGAVAGDVLTSLGLGAGVLGPTWFPNPFELLINNVAGLPSPAGHNRMELSVDTAWVTPALLDAGRSGLAPEYTITPGPLDFGNVEVGATAAETVAIENTSNAPLALEAGTAVQNAVSYGAPADFEIVGSSCAGQTLAPGATCELQVEFTPTAAGPHAGYAIQQEQGGFWFPDFGFFSGLTFSVMGVAYEPGSEPPAETPDEPVAPPAAPSGPNCLLGLGIDLGILCL